MSEVRDTFLGLFESARAAAIVAAKAEILDAVVDGTDPAPARAKRAGLLALAVPAGEDAETLAAAWPKAFAPLPNWFISPPALGAPLVVECRLPVATDAADAIDIDAIIATRRGRAVEEDKQRAAFVPPA